MQKQMLILHSAVCRVQKTSFEWLLRSVQSPKTDFVFAPCSVQSPKTSSVFAFRSVRNPKTNSDFGLCTLRSPENKSCFCALHTAESRKQVLILHSAVCRVPKTVLAWLSNNESYQLYFP